MKVSELIELLMDYDDPEEDIEVVLASDAEGNSYSPLSGAYSCYYVADTTWSGYLADETEQMPEEARLAIVLFPVN